MEEAEQEPQTAQHDMDNHNPIDNPYDLSNDCILTGHITNII